MLGNRSASKPPNIKLFNPFNSTDSELEQAARGTCGACRQFFRLEDILIQKSRTYVAIADLCGDFDLFLGEY